jgi:hypothetical protein
LGNADQKFSFSVNCACRPLLTVLVIFPNVTKGQLHYRLAELGRLIEEVDEFAANVQRALPTVSHAANEACNIYNKYNKICRLTYNALRSTLCV